MTDQKFLVTGSGGCIGAWVVRQLVREETSVVAFDVSSDRHRLQLVLSDAELERVRFRYGDIRDLSEVTDVFDSESVTHVIHLAALQVPACRSHPTEGASVNVTGTVNVFEAARRTDGQVRGIAFASSAAVFGPADEYPEGVADDDSDQKPATLYGVYKQATEKVAKVYAQDWKIGSIGLRPYIVYGPGRDQGMTSDPTRAMLAAASQEASHIGFGGSSTYHHVEDVAGIFVEGARLELAECVVGNVPGVTATTAEVVELINHVIPSSRGSITWDRVPLALPQEIRAERIGSWFPISYQRSLEEGITTTIGLFQSLLSEGLLDRPRDRE